MISNGENWHYLTVKNLSGLLRGITSNHEGDFYCLNCFHSYRTKSKLEAHKKICENRNYCNVEMPNEDNKIIKYNQGEKSIKSPFIIYADLECLLEKISTCYNNPEKSSTTEINKHTPSGYSLFTHCSFDETKNKLDYYRGEDCIKKFCKDLRQHATKMINYEKKDMIPLTKKEEENHNNVLLADVFENFRNTCLEVYELDPDHFLSLPGLAWQACLKKTSIKLELLTDYDMLSMVEEGIRGGICHSIHRYAKANNKYMKNYDENEKSSYIQYLDANN